jgi:AAHS family 4-hydroxybenzoate transporter-like MFS transporter
MARILASPVPWVAILGSTAVGFCLSGGQKANNALSVYFYPTALRGTGIGWALGIGRLGGVLGPFAAGLMLASGWSPAELFDAAAIPMVIGTIAIAAMGQIYGRVAPVAAAETM